MADDYTYWRVGVDDDVYLRRSPGHCDILTDGKWVPVDVEKYGAVDPWAAKIGNGEGTEVHLADVPVAR